MSRRIGALTRKVRLLIDGEHVLTETLKRTLAVVESLWRDACLVDGSEAVNQIFVYFWCAFLRNLKAERHVELSKERIVLPYRIAVGDGGTGRIAALRLAPHVTQDVVGEVNPDGVGRRRQALDEVGHLFRAEIQRNAIVLRLGLQAAAKQEGGEE